MRYIRCARDAAAACGRYLTFDSGSPVSLKLTSMQISRQTHLFLAIPYPRGTSFVVSARAASWCTANTASKTCELDFTEVASVAAVEASIGNVYHFDGSYLYLRVIQFPANYLGKPDSPHAARRTPPCPPCPQVWKETLRVYDQDEQSFEARLAALDDNAYNAPVPTGAD